MFNDLGVIIVLWLRAKGITGIMALYVRYIKYVMRFFVVNNTTKVPKIWIINGRKESYCCKKHNKMNNIFVQMTYR